VLQKTAELLLRSERKTKSPAIEFRTTCSSRWTEKQKISATKPTLNLLPAAKDSRTGRISTPCNPGAELRPTRERTDGRGEFALLRSAFSLRLGGPPLSCLNAEDGGGLRFVGGGDHERDGDVGLEFATPRAVGLWA